MTTPDSAARLTALHDVLVGQVEQLVTSADWTRFLVQSRRFHTYSPTNQALLVAQLLDRGIDPDDGYVASYTTWHRQAADGGGTCQVRRGERALWVFAPITINRDHPDATDVRDDGDRGRLLRGFKPVAVFHQSQLATPPALAPAVRPELLTGPDRVGHVWAAVVEELVERGFRVELHRRAPGERWQGRTSFTDRTVDVHDDLEPPQRLKTLVHEWAHIDLDHTGALTGPTRQVAEVEAESTAYLVLHTVDVDASGYTIPYVAGWAGTGGSALVTATADRVLRAAASMIDRLEHRLGVTLEPDPIQRAATGRQRDTSGRVEHEAPGPTRPPFDRDLTAGDRVDLLADRPRAPELSR